MFSLIVLMTNEILQCKFWLRCALILTLKTRQCICRIYCMCMYGKDKSVGPNICCSHCRATFLYFELEAGFSRNYEPDSSELSKPDTARLDLFSSKPIPTSDWFVIVRRSAVPYIRSKHKLNKKLLRKAANNSEERKQVQWILNITIRKIYRGHERNIAQPQQFRQQKWRDDLLPSNVTVSGSHISLVSLHQLHQCIIVCIIIVQILRLSHPSW